VPTPVLTGRATHESSPRATRSFQPCHRPRERFRPFCKQAAEPSEALTTTFQTNYSWKRYWS